VKNNRACECVSWNEEYGLLIQEYRTVNVNYFSEAPNETVEKTLVRKMFKKTSHNRLKNSRNVVRNTKNQTIFSVSFPFFKNNFWKVTYSTVSTV
jgi:hypothetical protein